MISLNAITNSISDDFPVEHIARLKKHNLQSFWIQMFLAFTLTISLIMAKTTDIQVLFIWSGILTLIGFYRLSHNGVEIKPSNLDPFGAKLWVRKYILLTTIMSVLWGTIGIIQFPQESLIQTTILIILVAVLISTIPLLLASKAAFFAQFIGILAPLTFSIGFNAANTGQLMLSLCLIALAISIIFASSYLNQVITQLQETQQALQAQADTDQLTQLANRRAFDRAFKKEWRLSTREHRSISLLIIDVDDFKIYNDTFGHLAGDECLKKIAGVIKSTARRPGDIAARIGGEEFAVLLPETDNEGAFVVAQTLQKNIQRLDIKHPSKPDQNLTTSIGVSNCKPVQADTQGETDIVYPAMLMKSADYAMYQAKRQGKNTIVSEACGMHSVPEPLKKMTGKSITQTVPSL